MVTNLTLLSSTCIAIWRRQWLAIGQSLTAQYK
jgi:hypothetical protein